MVRPVRQLRDSLDLCLAPFWPFFFFFPLLLGSLYLLFQSWIFVDLPSALSLPGLRFLIVFLMSL